MDDLSQLINAGIYLAAFILAIAAIVGFFGLCKHARHIAENTYRISQLLTPYDGKETK
jgi:hypothetical protein